MNYLLTSGGISNTSIHDALVQLLGKPIAESNALFIPTAAYAMSNGADIAARMVLGATNTPFCEIGWKWLGILELTALPSVEKSCWVDAVRNADALLVGGGDCRYLAYWMRHSGLLDLLPSLKSEMVYVGLSAGSMVAGPSFGENYEGFSPLAVSDEALNLVDFSILPHLDHPIFPENSLANLEIEAAAIPAPTYLIDDQTAIKVVDGVVEVISEGHWKLVNA